MDLETETRQNSKDIAALTNTVVELATMVKYSEEAHKNDRQDVRDLVSGLKALNEKIGGMASVQKEMAVIIGEVGKLRHDIRNIENGLQGMPLLKRDMVDGEKKIASLEARLNEIEKWRDKLEGAGGILKGVGSALWAVFGTGILAIGFFIFQAYFKAKGGGSIGGD